MKSLSKAFSILGFAGVLATPALAADKPAPAKAAADTTFDGACVEGKFEFKPDAQGNEELSFTPSGPPVKMPTRKSLKLAFGEEGVSVTRDGKTDPHAYQMCVFAPTKAPEAEISCTGSPTQKTGVVMVMSTEGMGAVKWKQGSGGVMETPAGTTCTLSIPKP
jgi:hypothetical protein